LNSCSTGIIAICRDLPTGIRRLFKRRPSEETIAIIAKMFGGNIGEVFRRNHGGEWTIQMNVPGVAGPVIALKVREGDTWFPPGKAYERILNGEEDNVSFFHTVIVARANETLR
jgi:hypothetical protein